jgi:pyruvate/oxaloacetate carboxyltransferase
MNLWMFGYAVLQVLSDGICTDVNKWFHFQMYGMYGMTPAEIEMKLQEQPTTEPLKTQLPKWLAFCTALLDKGGAGLNPYA